MSAAFAGVPLREFPQSALNLHDRTYSRRSWLELIASSIKACSALFLLAWNRAHLGVDKLTLDRLGEYILTTFCRSASIRLTSIEERFTLGSGAKGASSPRKGPCPPPVSQFDETSFSPDSCGLQATLKGASYVREKTTRQPQPRTI